jgi:hypothetical protein
MRTIEDFTAVPAGRSLPCEGRVDVCPICGRRGIEEHPEAERPYFLHVQTHEVLCDGMLTEPSDRCELREN